MSRITKQIATAVSNQLILSKNQDLEKERSVLSELTTKIYLKSIPQDVLKTFETHPSYFKTQSFVDICEKGFNYERFNMTKALPICNSRYYAELSPEDAVLLRKQHSIVVDLKNQIELLRRDIENAIFNLRTYNNVEKEFPEAFKLLPKRQSTALIVNLNDIRCKLDKANC